MDWDVLTIIATLGMLMWWLVKPIRDSLGAIKEEVIEVRKEVREVRKDVKQNSERIARIEGIIWSDIEESDNKKKGRKSATP